TPSRRAGAKVENILTVFQGALSAPSFARASLDARAPNQFCLAIAVDQLAFHNLTSREIKNCNLLPTGMEITPYNDHEGFS
ncbi:MAG: hypothetical protein ABSD13_17530, partial [Candidatus Korobacteraceae bacterium]